MRFGPAARVQTSGRQILPRRIRTLNAPPVRLFPTTRVPCPTLPTPRRAAVRLPTGAGAAEWRATTGRPAAGRCAAERPAAGPAGGHDVQRCGLRAGGGSRSEMGGTARNGPSTNTRYTIVTFRGQKRVRWASVFAFYNGRGAAAHFPGASGLEIATASSGMHRLSSWTAFSPSLRACIRLFFPPPIR